MVPKDDEATTPKAANPVTLRLGELEPHVTARMGDGAAGAIVKRDLGRYYALLHDALRRIHFSLAEAEAVVFALNGFDAASIRYLWAEVERCYLENDDQPETPPYWMLPNDLDAAALVEKLRELSLTEAIAVLDAVQRYWTNYPDAGIMDDELDTNGLIEVGLVFKARAENDQKKRKAEQGKMIVRDPAARLRRKQTHEPA